MAASVIEELDFKVQHADELKSVRPTPVTLPFIDLVVEFGPVLGQTDRTRYNEPNQRVLGSRNGFTNRKEARKGTRQEAHGRSRDRVGQPIS